MQSRDSLANNPKGRNMLYFNKGLEQMNKECDLAYIVKHVRILRYFLRTVLDKDQRVLLKLKATKFLDSDNEKPNSFEFRQKFNKDMLLDLYIEYIQKKNLTK